MDARAQEREAMRRVAQGDARAFRALVELHLAPITRHASRLLQSHSEAEEVAQETFLKLWQGAETWRPEARLSTWLHRIAHNACVDRLRRRREQGGIELDERAAVQPRASLMVEQKRRALGVREAVARLPERQRAALSLVHFEGLSNIEAAQVMQISVDALESLLARGRRSLRAALREA